MYENNFSIPTGEDNQKQSTSKSQNSRQEIQWLEIRSSNCSGSKWMIASASSTNTKPRIKHQPHLPLLLNPTQKQTRPLIPKSQQLIAPNIISP